MKSVTQLLFLLLLLSTGSCCYFVTSWMITTSSYHTKSFVFLLTVRRPRHRYSNYPYHTTKNNDDTCITHLFMQHTTTGSNTDSNIDRNLEVPTNCIVLSPNGGGNNNTYRDIEVDISTKLSIPIYTLDEIYNHHNNHHTTIMQQQLLNETITHALVVQPYTFGTIQNYSIGIIQLSVNEPSIRNNPMKKQKQKKLLTSSFQLPLMIDFMPLPNTSLGQRTMGNTGTDLLLKAIHPRSNHSSSMIIYDLTAGLGQDALLMAHSVMKFNGHIHMVERNSILFILLSDALRRLQLISSNQYQPISYEEIDIQNIATKLYHTLSLEYNDGINVLHNILQQQLQKTNATVVLHNESSRPFNPKTTIPDIIYLDPMFPIRKKSASVKKNMQLLHSLLHSQQQQDDTTTHHHESELLYMSYQIATNRVVVKRPIHVPPIVVASSCRYRSSNSTRNGNITTTADDNRNKAYNNWLQPSYPIIGSINRWDVYIKT